MTMLMMPKATAVWLVDNTTLTFEQIAEFTGMHDLEIAGIADGEVAVGIKGVDPTGNHQLTRDEITRCEGNPKARLQLLNRQIAPEQKRKGPRYTPLSKRQDRPAAIAWLVRYHPELVDSQISKLVGTTKQTIQTIREKSHWNMSNIRPIDPVALGLCKQMELDEAVRKAAAKTAKTDGAVMTNEERINLMSTSDSLSSPAEPRPQRDFGGLENFSLIGGDDARDVNEDTRAPLDPESFFNLPGDEEEDEAPEEKR